MRRMLEAAGALLLCLPAAAFAQAGPEATGWQPVLGRLHPALVHFPVALVVTAVVAEALCIARRDGRYAEVAKFLITAAAWTSIPAAVTGFIRAETMTFDSVTQPLFAVHRLAGIATPVLVFLCAGLGEGVRRSGQIWELMLYRVVMVLAAACAVVAGYVGGEMVFGAFPRW